jgi:hypothetical protein
VLTSQANSHEHETDQSSPTTRTPNHRRISVLVGREEPQYSVGWKQHPSSRDVDGRIPRSQLAEVNDASKLAASGNDVRRVQVGMHPERRPRPGRSRQRVVPDGSNSGSVDLDRNNPLLERPGELRQTRTYRSISWRLTMQ